MLFSSFHLRYFLTERQAGAWDASSSPLVPFPFLLSLVFPSALLTCGTCHLSAPTPRKISLAAAATDIPVETYIAQTGARGCDEETILALFSALT